MISPIENPHWTEFCRQQAGELATIVGTWSEHPYFYGLAFVPGMIQAIQTETQGEIFNRDKTTIVSLPLHICREINPEEIIREIIENGGWG